MADPLKKVQSGEKLRMPAAAYNAFIDAARSERSRQHDQLQEAGSEFRQSGIVRVRNDSGEDRDRFDILAIVGPIITPADNLQQFKNQVALIGEMPAAGFEGKFVVLLEPLADGATGRAVISGITPARVDLVDPLHTVADVTPDDATKLTSGHRGNARILWHDEATDWTVVRVGDAGTTDIHIRFGWVTEGATASDYSVVVLDSPYGDAFDVIPPEFCGTGGQLGTAAVYRWDDPTSCQRLALDKDDDHEPDIQVRFASPYFGHGIGQSLSEGSLVLLISNVELRDGMEHGQDGVQIWGMYLQVAPQLRDLPGYDVNKHLVTDGSGIIGWDDDLGGGDGWVSTQWPDFAAFLAWLLGLFQNGCGLKVDVEAPSVGIDPEALTDECSETSLAPVDAEAGCNIKVLVGCGIKRETNAACGADCSDGGPGSLTIDVEAIAGKGLMESEDNDPCECKIDLRIGCGLEFDDEEDDAVRVKVDEDGCLVCDEEDGLNVKINPDGCIHCLPVGLGITTAENGCITCGVAGLDVDIECLAERLAGNCLVANGDNLDVQLNPNGCLQCTPSGLAVDLVAGAGLGAAGCTLFVNVGNCIEIVGDAVSLKIDPEETCLTCGAGGLKLASKFIKDVECAFTFEGDALKLTLTKTFCDDTVESSECTVPTFNCEEEA